MLSDPLRISFKFQQFLYLKKNIAKNLFNSSTRELHNFMIPIYITFLLKLMNQVLLMNLQLYFLAQLETLTLESFQRR